MQFHAIVLVIVFLTWILGCSSEQDNPELGTFGGLSRRDRTSTTTTTTARSVISEKKIEEEQKEIPVPPQREKSQPNNIKPSEEGRTLAEDRTFGRDGLKNIMLGGVIVAVINIAPVILSGLKTVVNLALPILGLLLFRKHRSFRYFDDFMDMFEEYTNDDEETPDIEPDEKVINNDEQYPTQNYPYANYDYNYFNTNPYRGYGY